MTARLNPAVGLTGTFTLDTFLKDTGAAIDTIRLESTWVFDRQPIQSESQRMLEIEPSNIVALVQVLIVAGDQ